MASMNSSIKSFRTTLVACITKGWQNAVTSKAKKITLSKATCLNPKTKQIMRVLINKTEFVLSETEAIAIMRTLDKMADSQLRGLGLSEGDVELLSYLHDSIETVLINSSKQRCETLASWVLNKSK